MNNHFQGACRAARLERSDLSEVDRSCGAGLVSTSSGARGDMLFLEYAYCLMVLRGRKKKKKDLSEHRNLGREEMRGNITCSGPAGVGVLGGGKTHTRENGECPDKCKRVR